jgi:hypothetical protein
MHIHILIPGIYKTHEELQISHMASVRFRAAIIAKYLPQHGSTVSFGETIPETSNIIYVGKIDSNNIKKMTKLWLNQIKFAKNKNIKIFVDYTDHHLGFDSKLRFFYEAVLKLADCIVTSSDHLKILLNIFAIVSD